MGNPVGFKGAFKTTTGAASSATAQEEVGVVRVETGGDKYKYIKATTTITQYYAVMYNSTDGYTVTNAQTTQFSPCGVAVTTLNGTYPYGWIKQRGVFTVAKKSATNANTVTAYYPLANSATAGQVATHDSSATNAGKAIGVCLAATTSTATQCTVYLECD